MAQPTVTPQGGTNIEPSLIQRVSQGIKYIISGAGPDSWFGPQQPLQPVAQDKTEGRAFDYPVGVNLRQTPRSTEANPFYLMRSLADSYDLLRIVLETRKDQIKGFEWEIVPSDPKANGDALKDDIKLACDFFESPDKEHTWDDWLSMLIEDLLVIDAVAVYPRMNRGGKLYSLELIDAATITRKIDATGRTPIPPEVAYQQILHGIPANDLSADQLVYMMRNPRTNRLYGFCFAPDMEILTRTGWKPVSEAGYGDEFATRNPETHAFEWQSPVAITSREFDGELVHFKAKCLDILVTPEHRMIARCSGRHDVDSRERTITADELAQLCNDPHWQIPVTSDGWLGVEIKEKKFGGERVDHVRELRSGGMSYTRIADAAGCTVATVADIVTERYGYQRDQVTLNGDDYCAFIGMYLSEGSINKGRIAVISQTETSKHFEKFRSAIAGMFKCASHSKGDFSIHCKPLADHLKQFGHSHEKYIPDDIMNATHQQIETFLEFLFDGDSHRSAGGGVYYYTTSRRLADQVQELVQKTGKSASIRVCAPRSSVMADGRIIKADNCRVQYRVSINRRTHLHPHASRVPYKGTVHCLSVPNQTVYVRRNGYAAWTKQSPVEQIIMTVNIALRRQVSQLEFYTSGNVPEAIAQVPENWTPKQVADFQLMWDAMNEGNTAQRRKMRFVPSLKDIVFPKDAVLKDEYDEWLARIVCFAFSIPPTAFVKQQNRATAEQAADSAKQEGLVPLMRWIENKLNYLLKKHVGMPHLKFQWKIENVLEKDKQAAVDKIYLENKVITPDEVREREGMDALTQEQKDALNPPQPEPPQGKIDPLTGLPYKEPVAPKHPDETPPTKDEVKKMLEGRPQVIEFRPEVTVEIGDSHIHMPKQDAPQITVEVGDVNVHHPAKRSAHV